MPTRREADGVVAETGERPGASARRSAGVRLSELMAALSFSTDLGLGQPMEHVLRSCLIALRLAQMVYVLGQAGSDRGAAVRARTAAGIALTGGRTVEARFLAHCAVTRQVARRLGLPPGVDETPWDRVIAAEPSPRPPLTEEEFDRCWRWSPTSGT